METNRNEFFSKDEQQAFDTMREIVVTHNKRIALPGEPTDSLMEALMRFDDRSFSDLCAHYGNRIFYSKLDRETALGAIVKDLLDHDYFTSLLLSLDTASRNVLVKIAAGKVEANAFVDPSVARQLKTTGLAMPFIENDSLIFIVPKQIKQVLRECTTYDLEARLARNDNVSDYIVASMNLYGLILLGDLLDIINSQCGYELTEIELYELAKKGESFDEGYFLDDSDFIACEALEEWSNAELYSLAGQTETIPRYVPDKAVFLKHASSYYFEPTMEADMLEMNFNVYFPSTPPLGEEALLTVQDLSRQGGDLDEVLDVLFDDFGIDLELIPDDEDLIEQSIIDVMVNTRTWIANGNTLSELETQGLI